MKNILLFLLFILNYTIVTSWTPYEEQETKLTCSYQLIGNTADGIHIVVRKRKLNETFAQSILLLEFKKDQKIEIREISPNLKENQENREKILIRKVGEIPLSNQWQGKITLSERTLSISGLNQLQLDQRPFARKSLIPYIPGANSKAPVAHETSVFLDKIPYINPKVIEELVTWISDGGDQVVSINLPDAQKSSRFQYDDVGLACRYEEKGEWSGRPPFFEYDHLGKTDEAVHILRTDWCGGGTGIFGNLLMVVFEPDLGMMVDWPNKRICWNKERLLIKKLGQIGLGDRIRTKISIKGHTLFVLIYDDHDFDDTDREGITYQFLD